MSTRFGRGDVGFFDRFAGLYDPLMPSARVAQLHEAFAFADRPVRRVLDLAGGTGRVADALQGTRGPSADTAVSEAVVVDISAPMLARARKRGLPTVRADAGTLPFREGTVRVPDCNNQFRDCKNTSPDGDAPGDAPGDAAVDALVIVDAYHHLPDQPTALAEAARVVAPGGVVVIRDFDPETLVGRAIEAGEALFGMGSRFVDVDGAAAALTRAGLESRVIDRGWTYTVVGRRSREEDPRDQQQTTK